jgi:hypothetical protein
VEVRGCKIVMILNEDGLRAEDRSELDQYREKIFDLEYQFAPSVNDSVAAIVPEEEHRQRILAVFEATSLKNLRIVSKVHSALKEFEGHLSSENMATARIMDNVAKISAFRWSRGISITCDMLESSLGVEIRRASKSDKAKTNPLEDLILATDFAPSAADEVILAYLDTGRIGADALKKAFEIEKNNAREGAVIETSQELVDQFNSSFGPIGPALLDKAERVLKDCIGACRSWSWPFQLIWLLEQCGRTVDQAKLEMLWAKEFPLPEGGWASEFARQLGDAEARAEVERRFAARQPSESPDRFSAVQLMTWLPRAYVEGNALGSQPSPDPDWLFNQLRSAQRPKLIISLRELWQKINDSKDDESLVRFRDALSSALDRLADVDEISKARIAYIRSSPSDQFSPQDSTHSQSGVKNKF